MLAPKGQNAGRKLGGPATSAAAAAAGGHSWQQQQQQGPRILQGKVVLLDAAQFEVQAGYHGGLLQLFKEMPTRCYEPATKRWTFQACDYDRLMQRLRALQLRDLRIEPLPPSIAVILARRQKPQPPPTVPDIGQLGEAIGRDLAEVLLPFQVTGVQFVLGKSGRALIGDDMGLGKTVQAIAVALYYRAEWPALIVTPSSVRYAWRSQALRWAGRFLKEEDVLVLDNGRALAASASRQPPPLTIVSYDLLSRCADELAAKAYQVVIFDESHFLKNPKTARTKAAVRVAGTPATRRLLLLSGTPALSRPSELYPQIAMLRPQLFRGGFHEFGKRYCDPKQHPWGTDYSGSSNMPELRLLLEDALMIRRLKSDVLDQLPPKRRQMIVLDPTSLKRREALSGLASEVAQPAAGRSAMERRGLLLEYFHATARVKAPAVKQYLLDLLEASETRKFLVFAHHAEFLDEIDSCLTERAVPRIRIDGRTAPEARHTLAETFQTDPTVRVAVLSITAAGTGVNLTAASLVVFAELFWNPGILLQAEDRAYRIGQQNSVCVHYLVAQGTADDHLWPLVQRKLEVLGSAGLNRETFRDADTTYLRLAAEKQASIAVFFQEMLDEEEANRALFADGEAAASSSGQGEGEGEGEGESRPPEPKRYKKCEVKKRKEQLQLGAFFDPSPSASPATSQRTTTAASAATTAPKNDVDIDADALLAGIPDAEWDFDWGGAS